MENVLQFLTGLSENNTREWFNANKKAYDESRKKVMFLWHLLNPINPVKECVENPIKPFNLIKDMFF